MSAQENMKSLLAEYSGLVDNYINTCVADAQIPPQLYEAMRYSLVAGGKRIRPVLCVSTASLCGMSPGRVLPFAVAIEMIHTYSLIHDDLPAMDNDDMRRGKPSCHKAFGEAMAILAGDGLLTDAFTLAASCEIYPSALLSAIRYLARAAGSPGMVGGQALDMLHTGKKSITLQELVHMQALKTGAMLEAACVCGAILADATPNIIASISAYGKALGKAFQITDDILDITGDARTMGKPVGSDMEKGKNTWPSLAGLAESQKQALAEANAAKAALDKFSGKDADFLRALADYIVQRSA